MEDDLNEILALLYNRMKYHKYFRCDKTRKEDLFLEVFLRYLPKLWDTFDFSLMNHGTKAQTFINVYFKSAFELHLKYCQRKYKKLIGNETSLEALKIDFEDHEITIPGEDFNENSMDKLESIIQDFKDLFTSELDHVCFSGILEGLSALETSKKFPGFSYYKILKNFDSIKRNFYLFTRFFRGFNPIQTNKSYIKYILEPLTTKVYTEYFYEDDFYSYGEAM